MTINFSSEPYFDDFSEDKHFYKILFKPGYAVQARELNQLQTIIQNQITKNGQHFFKEGAMVIPGQVSFDNEIFYVKLQDKNALEINTNAVIDSLVGTKLYGRTSGVVAEVLAVTKGRNLNPPTLYVRYVSSGAIVADEQHKTFAKNEELTTDLSSTNSSNDVLVSDPVTDDHTGKGSLVSIERGIYFTNGYFVQVEKQSLVLSAYTQTPTARVGLLVKHTITTSDQDESLLDNAQNTPNYAAPGADRYTIDLVLTSSDINSEDDKNFIELIRVEDGSVKKEIRSTDYSVLEQTLARRTYDESGDYVVRDFKIDVRENRNNDRGTWAPTKDYIIGDVVVYSADTYVCKTTHTSTSTFDSLKWTLEVSPYYNRGIKKPEDGGSDDILSIAIEPGKAYVQGYEIEKIATEYVEIPKARGTDAEVSINEGLISYSLGSYVVVNNLVNGPLKTYAELASGEETVLLNVSNEKIGTIRIVSIEKHSNIELKLFIRDMSLLDGKYIQDAVAIGFNDGTISVRASLVGSFNIIEPNDTSLIIPLPFYAIKEVTTSETNYTVRKVYRNVGVSGGEVTLTSGGGDFASHQDATNYLVLNSATGEIISGANVLAPTGSIVKIQSLGSLTTVDVIATIKRTGLLKTKTLHTAVETFSLIQAQEKIVKLANVDGLRLKSVKMLDTATIPDFTIDITERYFFNDGQKDYMYDYASLVLQGSFSPASNDIQVTYEYFSHGTGDYFSVNSYSDIDYKAIPYFKNLPLRDCLDFRTDGSTFLKRGEEIFADFVHYLSRNTKLSIDSSGKVIATHSEYALNPSEVKDVPLAMTLASISLNAYTFDTSENNVKVSKVDNRRYTMRDIGRLESRIDNLEYYTSLSLLEQDTQNLDIRDSNGDSRFKNGFIVDSFTGHGVGDAGHEDYRCSVDMENGILRPFFVMRNVSLVEKNISRVNYEVHGNLVTLPISQHVPFINQPYGSRTENVNPFAVYTFVGTLDITPVSDDWFETDRKPDIVNNVDGNFNAISALSEKAGVLGTVWNSWQTTWTGSAKVIDTSRIGGVIQNGETNQSKINKKFGRGIDNRPDSVKGSDVHGTRYVTTETVATPSKQTRNGVRTSIASKVEREVVADKVLNTSVIPYIRSRNVLIKANGLKPLTRYYAFFDNVNVTSYIDVNAIKVIEYTPVNGKDFDDSTNAGAIVKTEKARHIGNEISTCLVNGDVIKTSSGITAVVVGKHHIKTLTGGTKYYIRVCNIKGGTFNTTHTFTGSISGATGKFVAMTSDVNMLLSNRFGELEVLFCIPNSPSVRFRTGAREFKLVDTKDGQNSTSRGSVAYYANGIIETKQATVNAIRNAQIVKEAVNDSQTVVQRSSRVVSDTGWYDPLAQTFLVESKGGAFLTKVDLFFSSKDENLPVTIEIREVVNGYPGKSVLPFSRVVKKSSDIKISTTSVKLNGESIPKYDVATTFEFESPVYVNDSQEYCLVIMSDSNKYKVWISQMGDIIPDGNRTISEQPYSGVLFKSQNASTWTADQYQDLKFTLYKAKFNKGVSANVEFVNSDLGDQLLESNPLHLKAGKTLMRVFQKDHGFKINDTATLSGIGGTCGGIDGNKFNRSYIVVSAQIDSYVVSISDVFDVAQPAVTSSGYFGGDSVTANYNIKYSIVQPNIQIQSFPETVVTASMRETLANTGFLEYDYSPVILNDNNEYFEEMRVVNAGNSTYVKCNLTSTNENVSPIIDLQRTSLIVISNKIDDPTLQNTNYGGFDENTPVETFFISDVKDGATTYSAYVTKAIKLLAECEVLNIRFAANIPSGSDIKVYRRTLMGDSSALINKEWTEVFADKKTFVEVGDNSYIDTTFSAELENDKFNVMQVKIVFKSSSSALVPSIKDLRILALA